MKAKNLFFMMLMLTLLSCSTNDDNTMLPETGPEQPEQPNDPELPADSCVIDSTVVYSQRDGKKIYGVMYFNAISSKSKPAVILSHSSSLTHEAMAGYAKMLAEKDYAAYCFDFCGGSANSKSDGSTDEMTIFTEVDDLKAVVKTIKEQNFVEKDKIFLLGSSQGGLVSALLAEELGKEISGLILFYPAYNIPEMVAMFGSFGSGFGSDFGSDFVSGFGSDFGSGFGSMFGGMSTTFVESLKDYDVWEHVGKYPNPVCIIHGTNDFIVPISYSEKAATLYPNATLHKIDGATHGFNEANLGGFGSILGGKDYDAVVMPIVFEFLTSL